MSGWVEEEQGKEGDREKDVWMGGWMRIKRREEKEGHTDGWLLEDVSEIEVKVAVGAFGLCKGGGGGGGGRGLDEYGFRE